MTLSKTKLVASIYRYTNDAKTNEYISQQIPTVGYDETRMGEATSLLEEADLSREKQLSFRTEARAEFAVFYGLFKASLTMLQDDFRLFRSTFRDDIPAQKRLELNGRRKRDIHGHLEGARKTYKKILSNPNLMGHLAKFAFTAESIDAKLAALDELEAAYAKAVAADKLAQDATAECDKAFDRLTDWLQDFQAACRICLKDRPQLMEKVGILVRSAPKSSKSTDDTTPTDPGNGTPGDGTSGTGAETPPDSTTT
ncbi:MAG: hypothetical protein GY765_09950 [bacterium]|nr:hypothetical protein [bacterium]